MLNFARGLGIQSTQPNIWNQLEIDCCSTTGVTCNNELVVTIIWYSMGLNGTINGTAIPSGVFVLDLELNPLLSGSIPAILPNGLTDLYLRGNNMSGDLPIFPSSLQKLELGYPGYPGNHFTGSLTLNRPLQVYINDNWITDIVILDSSALTICDLSNSPLLGNSNINGLTMCTKNGLYSPSAIKIDCPDIINLALGLGIQTAQPPIWASLQIDCCSTSGIICVGQRATSLNWSLKNLNGVLNGTALVALHSLSNIDMSRNSISGSIPTNLPASLIRFSVWANQFTSTIPINLPIRLLEFDASHNRLSGGIPAVLPVGLQFLRVHNNQLSGDVPFLPFTLTDIALGWVGNPFGNHFTGFLIINAPVSVRINGNWITNVIIQDTSLLYNCDLSHNPLLGNPSIASLYMCFKNGLYSANLLPITYSIKSMQFVSNVATYTNATSLMVSQSAQSSQSSLFVQSALTDSATITTSPFKFHPIVFPFVIDLNMIARIVIGFGILMGVVLKTPFKRAFQKIGKKKKDKDGTFSIDL